MPRKIGGFLVGMLGILGFFVLYGLLTAYRYSIHPVLYGLAFFFDKIRIHAWKVHIDFGPWIADNITTLDHNIAAYIGRGVLACEKVAVRVFYAFALLWSKLGRLIGDLAVSVLHAFQVLRHRVIPKLIHAAVSILRRLLLKLWRWVRHAVAAVVRRIVALAKWARHAVAALWKRLAGIYKWARHALGVVFRQLRGLWKWVRHFGRYFGKHGLLGFAGKVIHWLGLGWLLARNVGHLVSRVVRWSWHVVSEVYYGLGKVDGNTTVEVFAKVGQREVHTVLSVVELLLADYGERRIAPRYKDKLPPTV